MSLPSITVLEELVPELARLAHCPKSSQQQIDNFITLIKTAALRWVIERSLYNRESDLFVEIESEWFDCATWINKLYQKIPNAKQKTIEYYLFDESTGFYQDRWKKLVIVRYQINHNILEKILNLPLFNVTDRSLRNNFQRLSKIEKPKLIKSGHTRGKYKKNSTSIRELETNPKSDRENYYFSFEEDSWNFLNEGVSAIAEMLLNKINGTQRLFLQTEYVLQEEVQEIAEDWADRLRIIWQSSPISLIKIKYYSASQNKTNNYIVYPVCLHYYQRAYYLSAVGENPQGNASLEVRWYNYRLDRILAIEELSWDYSTKTQSFKSQIYQKDRINYSYTPDYIQEQLDLAYGFDFYREAKTMLLRFNRDYHQRYIQDTNRHATFEKINDLVEVKNLIIQQLVLENKGTEEREKILRKIDNFAKDSYYKLCYRTEDHNVMMRLRSWGANIEVIFPLDLRQKMKQDIQKVWQQYLV